MRLIDADDKGNITIVFDNEGRGIIKRIDAPTVQAIPIEVLQEIRQEINKAIDCIPYTFSRNNADDCLKRDIKDIFDKHIKEIEDIGDYPDEISNQFDNMTGSMNL